MQCNLLKGLHKLSMIIIKQQDKEWRIGLDSEVWKAKDIEEVKLIIEEICKLKDKYGKIKNE
jgi:hypothetical protein